MKHFTWDYEESTTGYYHIYTTSAEGDRLLGNDTVSIILDAPRNERNDQAVRSILAALEILAEGFS